MDRLLPSIPRGRLVAAMFAAMVSCAPPATAQTRLHLLTTPPGCGGDSCEPGRLLTIDVDRRAVVANYPARPLTGSSDRMAITGDGEYVVWIGLDPPRPTATLSATAVTTGASVGIFLPLSTSHVFTDRVAHQAFVSTPERDVLVVNAAGTRRIPVHCPPIPLVGLMDLTTMSGDRTRAFVRCPTMSAVGDTLVVDIDSGSRIATLVGLDAILQSANGDGSELFSCSLPQLLPPTPPCQEITRFDVASGAILAQRTLPIADVDVREVVHHERARRLFLRGESVVALDDATLEEVSRLGPPTQGASPGRPGRLPAWPGPDIPGRGRRAAGPLFRPRPGAQRIGRRSAQHRGRRHGSVGHPMTTGVVLMSAKRLLGLDLGTHR